MHRAGIAIVFVLIAVMFATLRMKCSISCLHLSIRAPAHVETATDLNRTISAVLRSANAAHCRYVQLGSCKPVRDIPGVVLSLNISRQLRMIPFASSNSRDPLKSAPASTFNGTAKLLKAALQSLLAAALLVAAFPYLLSTKWGTTTASKLASRMYPGDVTIERIGLGWAQPIAVEGVALHEGPAGASRKLLSFDRLSSAEPLYAVCRGKGLTLVVSKPLIDCSLDDTGEQSRLGKYFAAARLLNIISGPPSSSSSSISSASKHSASGADLRQLQEEVQQQLQQDSSTAAISGSKIHRSKHSSKNKNQAAGNVDSHPILASAESLEAAEAELAPAAASATAAAQLQRLSPLRQRLTQVDAVAHLSAELRMPRVAVFVPDGQLLLPQEVKAAVGSHIHVVAAAGAEQVIYLADELDEQSSWLQLPQKQQDAVEQRSAVLPDGGTSAADWPIPPQNAHSRSWASALPVLLQVSGDHVSGLVRGWRLGPERYVLQQPAQMDWEFTTELARLTLSQFNPLLEEVVSVKDGGHLFSSYSPTDGQLPASTGQVHVSPLKLQMGQGQLLKQIYKLLDISQSTGFKRAWSAESRHVDVWTGPLHVTIEGPGQYKTSRTDMIIGSGPSALHIAVWGSVDTTNDKLDMHIGLPAVTLAKAGFKNLPTSYVLPISVSGHLDKPQIDWPVAMRKLAVLSALQLGRDSWQGQVGAQQQQQQTGPVEGMQQGVMGLFGMANRALTNAASSFIGQVDQRLQQELQEVPAAAALPWETHQQQPYSRDGSSTEMSQGPETLQSVGTAAAGPAQQDR